MLHQTHHRGDRNETGSQASRSGRALWRGVSLSVIAAVACFVASAPAEARYGRNAAFVGGVTAGVVGSAAVRASRNNYYYGAPAYSAPPPGYARCY